MKRISDRMRLDFLERKAPHLDASCGSACLVYLEINGGVYRRKTIRGCVDAAIRAEKGRRA